MVRSPRAIALGAVYLFFGLLGPIMTKYLQDIVNRFESGVIVVVAHPTPQNGIAKYVGQVSQTGLIVVVVIAAGALA
jgi:ABC-2 type transport system permease protein